MTIDPYALTTHDGKRVDQITHHALLAAEAILGYELSITQGCYQALDGTANDVAASSTTHDGGGVVDLPPFDWRNKVRVLRSIGFAAWFRPTLWRNGEKVWSDHIHAVLIGNKKLSPSAMRQVLDFQRGLNGLADHGKDPDTFHPGVVFEMPQPEPKPPRPLVQKNRTRVAAVNMHAPGADDDLRMEHAIKRFNHLDFTVVALSEFNLPMARKLREHPKWGLHRAEPNSGTSGNAVAFWKPVWRRVAVEDIDVMVSSRVLHMAGLVLEHRGTGFVLPVLSIHNPTSTKNVHVPQSDRDLCIEAERRWSRRMTSAHGRAVVLGDFNQRGALEGTSLSRAVSHNVDEVYGRGALTFSKPQVHEGFNPAITDHAAVSVLINVTT